MTLQNNPTPLQVQQAIRELEQAVAALGGGARPWCSGTFTAPASLAANTYTPMTPTVNTGDATLVSGNAFVVPSEGEYILSVYSGFIYTISATMTSIIYLNNAGTSASPADVIGSATAVSFAINSTVAVRHLVAGDVLRHSLFSSVAQSSFSQQRRFYFSKIG